MINRGSLFAAIGILVTVVCMVLLSEGMLRSPTELLRRLRPAIARGEDGRLIEPGCEGDGPPRPAAKLSDSTEAKVARIDRGMTRGEVEKLLGMPAIVTVRSGFQGDGSPVRIESAVWLNGTDRIAVEFFDGVVQMVVSVPTSDLPVAQAPSSRPESKPQKSKERKPPASTEQAAMPKDLAETMRELEKNLLEKNLKMNHDPDSVFRQVFEATSEKK